MKSERIILSFIAVLVGLMAAGGTYFIYQNFIKNPTKSSVLTATVKQTPTPTLQNSNDYLTIQNPSDEMVTSTRSLQVNGKATKDATIIVSTPSVDQVAIASNDGLSL